MDVLNYDSAVSAFNNLEAFQSEKQQQFKEIVQQYKEGAEQVILPAIDLFRRGKEAYGKLTGEKTAATEGESAASEGESAISGAVEGVEGLASETLGALTSSAQSAFSGVTSQIGDFASSIRSIGNQLSERMRTNAFERDPEAEIASGEENMGILDKVQSVFRGGVSEASQGAESAISGASDAVSGAVSGASEAVSGAISGAAESVGTAVAEGVGSFVADAIPVVGELSMLALGAYDFFKSETAKAPVIQALATPILEKGV
jgi:phage-related protein